jgi:DNA-directed RNA polymerase specialized sigma24 family protein
VLGEVVQERHSKPDGSDEALADAAPVAHRSILAVAAQAPAGADPQPDEARISEEPCGSNESVDAQIAHLIGAVRKLPKLTRRVFTLRKVYGWEHDQIAEHLHVQVAEVQEHLCVSAKACARELFDPSKERASLMPLDVPLSGLSGATPK